MFKDFKHKHIELYRDKYFKHEQKHRVQYKKHYFHQLHIKVNSSNNHGVAYKIHEQRSEIHLKIALKSTKITPKQYSKIQQ